MMCCVRVAVSVELTDTGACVIFRNAATKAELFSYEIDSYKAAKAMRRQADMIIGHLDEIKSQEELEKTPDMFDRTTFSPDTHVVDPYQTQPKTSPTAIKTVGEDYTPNYGSKYEVWSGVDAPARTDSDAALAEDTVAFGRRE